GWGNVQLVKVSQLENKDLFEGKATFNDTGIEPVISLSATESSPEYLLAHADTTNLPASGEVEPLVGREWRSHNSVHRHAGQHVEYRSVCFVPGSRVSQQLEFVVEKLGVLRRRNNHV
ncbi:MAG: hypothetical protein ACREEM_21180, partial [Blastocatellia bacterium]